MQRISGWCYVPVSELKLGRKKDINPILIEQAEIYPEEYPDCDAL